MSLLDTLTKKFIKAQQENRHKENILVSIGVWMKDK